MANSLTTVLLNKSLTTMVKGIRANKDSGEKEYIQACLQEIKNEVQSGYADVKAMALRKLIYLQMIGYDMSWASFRVIEVMSASWFGHKRVGYLAAALSFTKDTDVILLATHLFRKSFTQNVSTDSATTEGLKYETGAALSCLASICTPDLAQDLLSDLYGMMNSTQPYLRKKATLVLLKVFQQWPKALRLSFDRLKDKLNDENQGVVSAAVYVICELAAKNPKNYLALAPQFFKILTTSSNNWVLIKVVKLLGSLVPLEPRLAKKLTEPLTDIINTTPAKSLLYECVNTLLSGELKSKAVIRLCLDKLKTFIEDADQNLKYLGLLGLHKLMKAHPVVVSEHKDLILDCLRDDDVTIRQRALDLVTSMVSKRNIAGIVRRLIEHLNVSDGAYREHVLERIIHICSQENFAYVHDFEWYLTTLVQLTELNGVSRANAARIKHQLMDVVIRVPAVRRFGVRAMSDLLLSNRLLSSDNANSNAMSEVLYACAWSVGEFAEYVTDHLELLQVMLKGTVAALPPHVQIIFVQSVLKVYASGLAQQTIDEKDNRVLNLPTASGTSAITVQNVPAPATPGAPATPTAAGGADILSFDILNKASIGSPAAAGTAAADTAAATAGGSAAGATDAKKGDDTKEDLKKLQQPEKTAKKRSFADWSVFVDQMNDVIVQHLPLFTRSNFVEVQERAVASMNFMQWVIGKESKTAAAADAKAADAKDAKKPVDALAAAVAAAETPEQNAARKQRLLGFVSHFVGLFSEPLSVVNKKAQRAVPLPDGLDLDKEIHPGAWAEVDDDEKTDGSTDKDDGYSLEIKDEDPFSAPKPKKVTAQEIEESKRQRAAADARRAHDPYYIKSGKSGNSSSSSAAAADLDKIPTKELGADELGGSVKVSGSGSSGSGKKKGSSIDDDVAGPAKVYTVLSAEEMPKGATVKPEAAAAKGKGGKKPVAKGGDSDGDVDLTTPLGADEVIPRTMTYAEKKAIADKKRAEDDAVKAAAAKAAADDKDKKKKKKKDEKDKKPKKSSKDKASSSAAAPASAAAPVASAAPPTATGNVLDFFDPLASKAASAAAAAKPVASAAPVAAAPASVSAAGEDDDGGKKKKHKSKSSSSKSAESSERLLHHSSSYSVRYVIKHNSTSSAPASGASALVLFHIKPKSSSVSALELRFAHSAKVKVIGTAKDVSNDKSVTVTLAKPTKNEVDKRMLQFDWVTGQLEVPSKVGVTITHTDSKGKHKTDVDLVFPPSAFVVAAKITPEEFAKLSGGSGLATATAAQVALGSSITIAEALDVVPSALNVAQVEAAAFVAKFSGRMAHDRSPVLVIVKGKKDAPKTVAVDIRAASQHLSDQLLGEVVAALK